MICMFLPVETVDRMPTIDTLPTDLVGNQLKKLKKYSILGKTPVKCSYSVPVDIYSDTKEPQFRT